MLLRNYDNMMTAKKISSRASGSATVFGDGHLTAKDLLESVYNIHSPCSDWAYLPLAYFHYNFDIDSKDGAYGYSNLICGSGNTSETYDDYKLASPFTSTQVSKIGQATFVTDTHTYNENDGTWTHTVTKTYIANESITIREIGVTSGFYYKNGNYHGAALVYRKVLDTPIEVSAGATFVLSFTATVSANPNNPNKPADYDASVSVE
jgi:hypothetical protein